MTTNLSKNIKVQVVCLAYNQVEFIRDALNGFVMQKTNFPFEVLVGDDCSTDGTSEIIAEYAKKYPHIITHIRRPQNMGAQENSFDLLNRVDADYLALCEGDDYWTSPNKLQMQVDLLEKNKHLNGCFHKTEIKKEKNVVYWNADKYFPKDNDGKQYWPSNLKKKTVQMADILPGLIATSSIVYRYNKEITYPEWFRHSIAGDRPLHCFMIKDGSFQYIDEVMSVYRISPKGVWFNKNSEDNAIQELKDWVQLLNNISDYFNNKYDCITFYKNETVKAALYKAFKNKNIKVIKEIMKNYSDIFFKNIKYIDNNSTNKLNYKFLGITLWKIKETCYQRKHYLFGFLQVLVVKSNRSFYER